MRVKLVREAGLSSGCRLLEAKVHSRSRIFDSRILEKAELFRDSWQSSFAKAMEDTVGTQTDDLYQCKVMTQTYKNENYSNY